jgi:hypothetical protein
MKRLLIIPILTIVNLNATSITELFNGLSNQPITKIDMINTQKAIISKKKIEAISMPKIDFFGNYTHYNSATNLKPIDPITTTKLTQNHDAIPFARNIAKIGIKISMPLFIKELSTLNQKANLLIQSSKLKKELNLYQNEALIVGYNSSLEYLDNLLLALNQTEESIKTTREHINISVNAGRTPAIALDKIDEKLNNLKIYINNIKLKKIELISKIETLTNIKIENHLDMKQVAQIDKSKIFALESIEKNLDASRLNLQATKEKRNYPKVSFNIAWNENYTINTINNKNDKEGYGYYQIGMQMPIYNKSLDNDIELNKISIMKNQLKLENTKQNLDIEGKKIQKELDLLESSEDLTLQNIQKKEELLKYAKVAFEQGRMTEEDYLRYEDNLLESKAKYYNITSQKWQKIAKLAVIYGNDLKKIIF